MLTSSTEDYCEPDDVVFVPGVDYVSGWRTAEAAASEVIGALQAQGVDAERVRAVPHAGVRGEPVVWLRAEDARLIARLLREAG